MEPPPLPLKSPVKPALITPSASPPPLRTEVRYSRPIFESAPASKRQRTTSTPRSATQGTPGPSSSLSDSVDIHQERRASTMRLLEFWDSLAGHTRALDDDDIVDIMTGKITRDNGVLRNSDKLAFGALDTPSADNVTSDEGSDVEDNEYDQDELDSFSEKYTDPAGGLRLDARGRLMPPVTPLDPADANDLREFMKAERNRRELCGTDVEEEDEEDSQDIEEYGEVGAEESSRDFDRGLPETTPEEEEVEQGYGRYSGQVSPVNTASDDELNNWTLDDGNIVYPVVKADAEEVQSEAEVTEDDEIPNHQKVDKGKGVVRDATSQSLVHHKRAVKTPQQQLYTPPQSSSSSAPSYTQIENDIIDLTVTLSPPAKSASRPRSQKKLSNSKSPKKKVHDPINRLGHEKDFESHFGEASSHLSSAPATRASTRFVQQEEASVSSSVGQTPKHNAFVLLTSRKSSSPQKWPSIRPDYVHGDQKGQGKNKMKESVDTSKPRKAVPAITITKELPKTPSRKLQSVSNHSQEGVRKCTTVSQSSPTKRYQARQPSREDDAWATPDPVEPDGAFFLSPTFPSPPIPRKRKRMLSDSEIEYVEPHTLVAESRRRGKVQSQPSSSSLSPKGSVESKYDKSAKRSSSQRRRRSPDSESESESSASNSSENYRSRSHVYSRAPSQYIYPRVQAPHPPLPRPPAAYVPMQDPRAHLILTQAMQQLSALVSHPWIPPHQYPENPVHTPSHRHHSRPSDRIFTTPTHHHHPYPYSYDPDLSRATLPPDSPDVSSPEKANTSRRKSLVRRSRSRGRRVSFHIHDDGDYEENDINSSPSEKRSSNYVDRSGYGGSPKSSKGKGRARTPYAASRERDADSDDLEYPRGRSTMYARGQTPGPSFSSPPSSLNTDPSTSDRSKKHHTSKQRLRGR